MNPSIRFSYRWILAAVVFNTFVIHERLEAQDPSFSQFYANRTYLNPAFTAIEGGISLQLATRMQWLAVDKGFRTYDASVQTQIPIIKMGVGLHLNKNDEGYANLSTTSVGFTSSYTIPGKRNNVHFGFEASFVEKSIDWDRLIFTDQIDQIYGAINNTSALPVRDKLTYGDISIGVLWRRDGKWKFGGRSFRQIRTQLGAAFHHLSALFGDNSRGSDSFLNQEQNNAPRATFHGGLSIPIKPMNSQGQQILISPNIKLDIQGYDLFNFDTNISVGSIGSYILLGNFYTALFYQNRIWAPSSSHTNSIMVALGVYLDSSSTNAQDPKLFIGLSADLNTTGVGPAAGSIFELQINYNISKTLFGEGKIRGKNGNRIMDCKSFF